LKASDPTWTSSLPESMLLENQTSRIQSLTQGPQSIIGPIYTIRGVLSIGKDSFHIHLFPLPRLTIFLLWIPLIPGGRIERGRYISEFTWHTPKIQVVVAAAAEVVTRVFAIVVEHVKEFGGQFMQELSDNVQYVQYYWP
jgi:hypothetical protein